MGLISTLFSFFIAAYYFLNDNLELSIGFLIIAIVAPIYNAATGYSEYLIAIKALRSNTIYSITTRIITLIVTLCAVYNYPSFAWIIIGATLLGTVIPNLIFHKDNS